MSKIAHMAANIIIELKRHSGQNSRERGGRSELYWTAPDYALVYRQRISSVFDIFA